TRSARGIAKERDLFSMQKSSSRLADMGSRRPQEIGELSTLKAVFLHRVTETGMVKKTTLVLWTITLALTVIEFVEARQQSRVPKIGWLETRSISVPPFQPLGARYSSKSSENSAILKGRT